MPRAVHHQLVDVLPRLLRRSLDDLFGDEVQLEDDPLAPQPVGGVDHQEQDVVHDESSAVLDDRDLDVLLNGERHHADERLGRRRLVSSHFSTMHLGWRIHVVETHESGTDTFRKKRRQPIEVTRRRIRGEDGRFGDHRPDRFVELLLPRLRLGDGLDDELGTGRDDARIEPSHVAQAPQSVVHCSLWDVGTPGPGRELSLDELPCGIDAANTCRIHVITCLCDDGEASFEKSDDDFGPHGASSTEQQNRNVLPDLGETERIDRGCNCSSGHGSPRDRSWGSATDTFVGGADRGAATDAELHQELVDVLLEEQVEPDDGDDRPRRTDGVAVSDRAAIHVDALDREPVQERGEERNSGERFVDLVRRIALAPPQLLEHVAGEIVRHLPEPCRIAFGHAVEPLYGHDGQIVRKRVTGTGEKNAARTVADPRGIHRRDASGMQPKRRFGGADAVRPVLVHEGRLISLDHVACSPANAGQRHDLVFQRTTFPRIPAEREASMCEFVLLGARDPPVARRLVDERAHCATRVRVLETIDHRAVVNVRPAETVCDDRGASRHGLHAAHQHEIRRALPDQIGGIVLHLEPRATHVLHRLRDDGIATENSARELTIRCLTEPGRVYDRRE